MTQARTKDRKFGGKEEENPDTEPATKGYVKCLLRKTREHTHPQRIRYGASALGLCLGCAILVFAIIVKDTTTFDALGSWIPAITMFSIACGLICVDNNGSDEATTYYSKQNPKCIKKFKPTEYEDGSKQWTPSAND